MKSIRILSPYLDLMGEIDNYLSLSFCRLYHSPGEFQIVTNRKVQNANVLDIGNIIMLGSEPYKTGIIMYKEIKTNEKGEEILTVRGNTLATITRQRITVPPEGYAYDIMNGNAETVMKHYVEHNCLNI